jgi:hypothetical protein
MRLLVERIPHEAQRYETIGDWEFLREFAQEDVSAHPNVLRVRVSILPRFESEIAVAIHEVVEALLCHQAGITGEEVDRFDMAKDAPEDPGADPHAPYHIQHLMATMAEQAFIRMVGMEWSDHDGYCDSALDIPRDYPGAGKVYDGQLGKVLPWLARIAPQLSVLL